MTEFFTVYFRYNSDRHLFHFEPLFGISVCCPFCCLMFDYLSIVSVCRNCDIRSGRERETEGKEYKQNELKCIDDVMK
jgi:hypothetical protein